MAGKPKRQTGAWLRRLRNRLAQWCLPFSWRANRELRRLDRSYHERLKATTDKEEQQYLHDEYIHDREAMRETIEARRSETLVRQARRYYLVPPAVPWRTDLEADDPYWQYGFSADEWFLRPTAFAELYRQIEDARARRRAVWESWFKIIGGLVTVLVALGSVIVSLVLAWKK